MSYQKLREITARAPYSLNPKQTDWVFDTLGAMTAEQKIRQIFCTIHTRTTRNT